MGPNASSMSELLKANELEPIQGETKAKTDGGSLVRILNRMIRAHKTRFEVQSLTTMNNNESTEESKTDIKQGRSRSRSRENFDKGKSIVHSIRIFLFQFGHL